MENKLDLLYQLISVSEKLGKPFPEDYNAEIAALEEQLIKDEVLPLILDNIEPILRRVKRPLGILVEYDPAGQMKVNLTRKPNVAAQIPDAKEITPDPVVEHGTSNQKAKKVVTQSITRLRITMPDGAIIQEKFASDSLVKFVSIVGPERVREVGLKANKVPLISNTQDPKYKSSQKPVGNGWYVMTCSDTPKKKEQIELIAAHLGLNVKVEKI